MNAAGVLAENGFNVEIFGIKHNTEYSAEIPLGVKVTYFGQHVKGLRLRTQFFLFCLACIKKTYGGKYKWIFAYNFTAGLPAFLCKILNKVKILYHNHDLNHVEGKFGFYPFLKHMEYRCARAADLVTFPQEYRAKIFYLESKIKDPPLIVKNAPRISWPHSLEVDPRILDLKKRFSKVALYQGVLDRRRGLLNIVKSMPGWDQSVALCFVGGISLDPTIETEIHKLAINLGVEGRVFVFPPLPYEQIAAVTKGCDIGIGVISNDTLDSSVNIKHLAGASNKIGEYLSCGLPVIVPKDPEFEHLIVVNKVGLSVEHCNINGFSDAINSLCHNIDLYSELSKNATSFFEDTLCFDKQFKPVLDHIQSTC